MSYFTVMTVAPLSVYVWGNRCATFAQKAGRWANKLHLAVRTRDEPFVRSRDGISVIHYSARMAVMTKVVALCLINLVAGFAPQISVQERQTLRLVQMILSLGDRTLRSHGWVSGKEVPVCSCRGKQYFVSCGPKCREGDQKSCRIQGYSGCR